MLSLNYPESELTDLVLGSNRYQRWRKRVESHGNQILQLHILSVVSRSPSTWYAAFIDCLMLTPEGNHITRCITIRGESVVVVPLMRCIDDDKWYTVMVEQRCICDGALHIGFPAGNGGECEDAEDLRIMACREMMEETGLEIFPNELMELSEGISINSSLSDDLIYFYGCCKDVTRAELDSIDNRNGGLREEGEYIRVKVFSLADCFKMTTASTLIGSKLIERRFGITV